MKRLFEEKKLHIGKCLMLVELMLVCLFAAACGGNMQADSINDNKVEPKPNSVIAYAGTYDSVDSEAVVVQVKKEEKQVILYNRTVDKQYTLAFDGTSKFYDKYGSSLVPEQIFPGDVVDVTFLKDDKIINSLQKSPSAWVYTDVKDFVLDALTGNFKMANDNYRFKDTVQIFSDGAKATLMDINAVDSLVVSGSGHEIYSIIVYGSHGYLRLKGQDYFVDGWIEVGTGIIKNVTEDMLLTVPIGTYEIRLSKGKYNSVSIVTIEKGKETLLDVGNVVTEEEIKLGDLIFVTTPKDVAVFIDGKEIDTSKPFKVEYGIHQLIARLEGYDTITQYIKVSQEHATLDITLDKSRDNKDKNDSGLKITAAVSPSVMETEFKKARVKIEAPEGAEVFLDGSYVGIVPVDFAKVAGRHDITLRKEGYETRSYTITLDDSSENESFSFALLKAEEEEEEEEANTTPVQNQSDNKDAQQPKPTPTEQPAPTEQPEASDTKEETEKIPENNTDNSQESTNTDEPKVEGNSEPVSEPVAEQKLEENEP